MKEAFDLGLIRPDTPTPEEIEEIEKNLIPKQVEMLHLRNPAHAKTKEDYLRISFGEEDAEFYRENQRKTIPYKQQKKLEREVLTDNWEEDDSLYKLNRKPWGLIKENVCLY